ncbi:inducible metalloproteinase inhibitor protein-like [Teleopsis dalmanni]|uniref:inducible metalloproteinase inhibitor protein-like n=1 Tax=Teleopsis dalmanni TaxID=139649 RepID=UPI0018CF09AB|nr:inducible metalloproteinase inhibitor protein-like [Teleopsis dalmanni]
MLNSRLLVLCCFLFVTLAFTSCEAAGFQPIPKDCPANEFYTSCGGSCQTECATLGEPCLIRHIRCPDGCYCNENYARDASGSCVPIKDCPQK